ncbi:MAG: type III-B CRISPR-associated protein Cas10/Cmr2 [Armatimonadota bacterium]
MDRLTPETVTEAGWEGDPPPAVADAVTALADARRALVDAAGSSPPRYYGIIALDGDHMGKWLSGDMTGQPVTEEFWRGVSGSLRTYAGSVRGMVREQAGYPVYAGGDDVLALNPLATALECAAKLRSEFPRFGTDKDGKPPTASAGLAIVHYQHDLRAGLRAARKAEHDAKEAGRDRLGISLVKRSGGQVDLVIEWDQVPRLLKLQRLFAEGLSDRWLYKLDETLPDLHPDLAGEALTATGGALTAIVAHSLKRIEIARENAPGLRRELGLPEDADAEAIKQALRDHVAGQFADWQRRARGLEALERFIKFGMIASFLHRGRD